MSINLADRKSELISIVEATLSSVAGIVGLNANLNRSPIQIKAKPQGLTVYVNVTCLPGNLLSFCNDAANQIKYNLEEITNFKTTVTVKLVIGDISIRP